MFAYTPPLIGKKSPLVCAILFALSFSNSYATNIQSWDELQNLYQNGDREFVVTADLSANKQLRFDENTSISLQGHSISPKPGITTSGWYFEKGVTVSDSGSFTLDPSTGKVSSIEGGISGFNGALTVQGTAMNDSVNVVIDRAVFQENSNSSSSGAAFQYIEQSRGEGKIPKNHVSISNSLFYKNQSGHGAVYIDRSSGTDIDNSVFEGNTADNYGGALVVARSQNTVIRDTSFFNNTAKYGGAIYLGANQPSPIQFGGSSNNLPAIEWDNSGWGGYLEAMNLTIESVNKDVIFSGNSAQYGSDIYISHSTSGDKYSNIDINLNLGAAEGRKIQFDGDITAEANWHSREELYVHINPKEEQTGEIIFNGIVSASPNKNIYFHRGTISLGSADSLKNWEMTFTTPGAPLKLNLGQGKIENYEFNRIYFDQNGNYELKLALDVDLANNLVDTINWGGIYDSSQIAVNVDHWNVLNDMEAGTQTSEVTINSGNTDTQLSYGLTSEGQKATGALYIYDVAVVNKKKGTYLFTNAGNVPEPEPEPEPDPEPQPEPEPEPEPEPSPNPTPTDPSVMKPYDFNSEVYANAINQKVTQLLQHEISHRLFDMNIVDNSLGISKIESLSNASVHGGKVSLNPHSYGHEIDVDYGIALFSYFNPLIESDDLSIRTGMYGGFVVANTEDHINDIDSKGAFLGVASKAQFGNAFADWHANVGYLHNSYGSKLGGSSNSNNLWLGTGLSIGYEFISSNNNFKFIPTIDAIYTYVDGKEFTTAHNVKIDNGNFKGWELSPGIRIEKPFGSESTSKFYAETRYVWSDDSTDLKAIHLSNQQGHHVSDQVLPTLQYGDYTELNAGIKTKIYSWDVYAGADCRIGDTDGWGLGLAAQLRF